MPSPPATPNLSDYFAADDSFMFPGQRLPTERQPRLSTASNEPTEQDAALLFNADTRSEDSKTKHNMPTFRRRIREGRLKAAMKKDEATHQTGTDDANDARLDQNHGNSPNVSTEISNSSFPSSRPRKRPRYIPSTGALAGQLVPRIESHEDEPIASDPRYSALKSSPDLSQHPTSPRSGMESTSETRQDPISPEFIDVSEVSDTGPAIAPNGTVETRERHIEAWRKSASKSGKLSQKRPHVLMQLRPAPLLTRDWKEVRDLLPQTWKWDVEYHLPHSKLSGGTGSWTCTPLEANEPRMYPLTIAKAPLVLPVEYHWPPSNGVSPPFDPHHGAPIDCSAELSLELVRDIFITFEGIIGFYVLINGLLQVIVPDNFNTKWASSHLPHTFGGLKVCYIERTLEPTMLSSTTQTRGLGSYSTSLEISSHKSGPLWPIRFPPQPLAKSPSLKLNDSIEARPLSNHRKENYAGRVGLKVAREGVQFLVMSTHIITEAILAKSHRDVVLTLWRNDQLKRLKDDWNDHVNICAWDQKVGTIDKTFDKRVGTYPDGFSHDVTLIKPVSPSTVEDITSPVPDLGWLNHSSWASLRQQTSSVRVLANAKSSRLGKTIKCSRPSDVLVIGEGIFLNQKAAAGNSKTLKDHDASTWKNLVSRALLYRLHPDFTPPNGHSGTALYADGIREDGSEGPGVVGFQSFVQRSGHVQNFEMEGPALERRLQLGRVAFYGAFEVPAELKKYKIV